VRMWTTYLVTRVVHLSSELGALVPIIPSTEKTIGVNSSDLKSVFSVSSFVFAIFLAFMECKNHGWGAAILC
jgi:hypothetical protein